MVHAQEVSGDDFVLTRERPEYDPLGIRAGAFIFRPKLANKVRYNDNVLAREDDEEDDVSFLVSPQARLESDWNNHALNLEAGADIARFVDRSDEDHEDYYGGLDGRLDINRDTNLSGGVNYSRLNEPRRNPDEADGQERTEFDLIQGDLAFIRALNRFSLRVDGAATRFDFDDADIAGGSINNDDRDRTEVRAGARGGYRIQGAYELFVQGYGNQRIYDAARDDNGLDRDSRGFEVAVGAAADFSGVTFGEVFFGWLSQDFDDGSLDSIDGPLVGASLTWNPSGLTAVVGSVERTVEETTFTGASGYVSTAVDLTVTHELLRNVILEAGGSFARNDYEGIGRDDDVYEAEVGARYLLNRNAYLTATYNFFKRDSDQDVGQNLDYDQNVFAIGLELQL